VPEGDTVWRAARRLDRALSGKLLTRTDVRVPAYATWDLSGAAVVDTVSRGKHLLTRIDAEEHWTLHTHLKMEGSWRVLEPGQRWPRPGHTARIVLETDDVVAVGFQLGIVEIVARDREPEIVGHLGPDLLGPDWDADEAVRRLHEHAEAGSAPPPTGPATDGTSAGHSWTSGASQVSARSTCARSSSWRASRRSRACARSPTWPRWCGLLTGC
jgi:formamidopyrimidine-DNA glycosylase